MRITNRSIIFCIATFCWSVSILGQEIVITEEDLVEEPVYSPYADRNYADNVYFGDMHFHTEHSFDAGLIGTTLSAHDGFRMARGEKVISNTGQPIQLIRPLDFLVITDHAEMIGLAASIRESSPILLSEEWGRWVHERFQRGTRRSYGGGQRHRSQGNVWHKPFRF